MSDGDSTFATGPSGLETGVQVGDFRIERRLGAGGMGIVYQARQLSLNRLVALKVLGQALTRNTDVTRFQREAQAAARLKHPSIAQVYFIGQDKHVCYMAMELIDGVSLRRVLNQLATTLTSDLSLDSIVRDGLAEQPGAQALRYDLPTEDVGVPQDEKSKTNVNNANVNPYLSPRARDLRITSAYIRRTCEIVRDVAQSLDYAHQQGVVHRDIKPDNLLLDQKGEIHIIDFGVARFFEDQTLTYTGQLVGTPMYMSPEQITARGAIDGRTDVYSLGLVLYELLTLKLPIDATNRENLLRTIIAKPLVPVSWRNSAVAADLENIIHRATEKDPDQRYATAGEFAADLERYLSGQPVKALRYRFRVNEGEIAALRPVGMVFGLFILLFNWLSIIDIVTSSIHAIFYPRVGLSPWIQSVSFFSELGGAFLWVALTIILTAGLLAAKPWARWPSVGLLGAQAIICGWRLIVFGFGAYFANQVVALTDVLRDQQKSVIGLVVSVGMLVALLQRDTTRWFQAAKEIRAEYSRIKEELAR